MTLFVQMNRSMLYKRSHFCFWGLYTMCNHQWITRKFRFLWVAYHRSTYIDGIRKQYAFYFKKILIHIVHLLCFNLCLNILGFIKYLRNHLKERKAMLSSFRNQLCLVYPMTSQVCWNILYNFTIPFTTYSVTWLSPALFIPFFLFSKPLLLPALLFVFVFLQSTQ